MLLKIVYLLTCRVLGLAVVVFRGDLAKDAELLVLRHENAVLRRHAGRRAPLQWWGLRCFGAAFPDLSRRRRAPRGERARHLRLDAAPSGSGRRAVGYPL